MASHNWLLHAPVFLGPPPSPLYVRDLIDDDTRQWDRGKILGIICSINMKRNIGCTFE